LYNHNIKVYGDDISAAYPKYNGLATEYTVKQALDWLVSEADDSDIIAFITAGHGGGDDGEDGVLYDTELDAILEESSADKIFTLSS